VNRLNTCFPTAPLACRAAARTLVLESEQFVEICVFEPDHCRGSVPCQRIFFPIRAYDVTCPKMSPSSQERAGQQQDLCQPRLTFFSRMGPVHPRGETPFPDLDRERTKPNDFNTVVTCYRRLRRNLAADDSSFSNDPARSIRLVWTSDRSRSLLQQAGAKRNRPVLSGPAIGARRNLIPLQRASRVRALAKVWSDAPVHL